MDLDLVFPKILLVLFFLDLFRLNLSCSFSIKQV